MNKREAVSFRGQIAHMQVALLEQLLQMSFQGRRCDLLIAGQIVVFQYDAVEFALDIVRARSVNTILIRLSSTLTILDVVINKFLRNQVALSHFVDELHHILGNAFTLGGIARIGNGTSHARNRQQVVHHLTHRRIDITMLHTDSVQQQFAKHNSFDYLSMNQVTFCIIDQKESLPVDDSDS